MGTRNGRESFVAAWHAKPVFGPSDVFGLNLQLLMCWSNLPDPDKSWGGWAVPIYPDLPWILGGFTPALMASNEGFVRFTRFTPIFCVQGLK